MSLSKSSIFSQQNLTAPNLLNDCIYEFEDFRLDAAHLMLYKGSATVSLKPRVVETLVALIERRGEVVGKGELMNRLWADSFVEESNLTQNIYLLRKTLGKCADGRPFIETFSRRGYRFNGTIEIQNQTPELLIATHTKTHTVIEEEITDLKPSRAQSWLLIGAVAVGGLLILSGFAFLNSRRNNPKGAVIFQNLKFKRNSDSGDVTSAAVSPDGRQLVVARSQPSQNIVTLTDKD